MTDETEKGDLAPEVGSMKRTGWAFRIGFWTLLGVGLILLRVGPDWLGVTGLLGAAGVWVAWKIWFRRELRRIRGHEPHDVRLRRWRKGGVRLHNLEVAMSSYVAQSSLEGFFIATKIRRLYPFTEFFLVAILFREYVVAVTDSEMAVLRLKLPAFFRAGIAGLVSETPLQAPTIKWSGKTLEIAGERYYPSPFFGDDAAEVAARCRKARSGALPA